MAFPINPTNGQTTVVNGITYTYSTALTAWAVTSSGSALTVATNVSAQGNITGNLMYANAVTVYSDISSGGNLVVTGTLESGAQNITGNVDVTGNINVTGNLNYSNVQQLVIGDPIIYVGADNTGNVYDLGMVVSYNDGTYQHGGWVRDASDGTWKLFGNVIPEPTTVVDFTNAIYQPMISGAISSTGTVTSTGLLASGIISASGNVTGANFNGGNVSITGNITAQGLTLNSGIFTTTLAAGTLQNTRINPRVVSTTSASTITINSDITDQYNVTALATATSIAAPTGTPVDGQKLTLRIVDNGTSRALSWNPIFIQIGSTLPTSTVPNKFLYIGCIYNTQSVSWDVVSVAQEV